MVKDRTILDRYMKYLDECVEDESMGVKDILPFEEWLVINNG